MRLKWLSLVHQQGYEKTVKSAHFHENGNFPKCSYNVSAAGGCGRVHVFPLKQDTLIALLASHYSY